MMSKAELARKAGLSTLTIDRVEAGRPCRLDTKRKILLALGLKVSDKDRIFGAPLDVPESSTFHGAPHGTPPTVSSGGFAAPATCAESPAQDSISTTMTNQGPNTGNGEITR
jgi:DNA-binding XRE family transcriptional regulator